MRFSKQAGFVVAFLVAGVGAAQGAGSGCVALSVHTEAVAVVESCTRALAANDLAAQQRATFLLYRGRGHKALKNLSAAENDFLAGVALAPDNVDLHVFLGWVAYDRQDHAALAQITTLLAERFPRAASVHDLIGGAALLRDDLATAMLEYNRALALDPDNVTALNHRAQLFWQLHDYESAIKDFATLAASKNPDVDEKYSDFFGRKISFRTLARLGRVQLIENTGHTERIEEAAADFVRVEPGVVSYGWAGMIHYRRGQFERSLAEFDKALSYDPDFWFIHNLRGGNLLYLKQYDRALQTLDRAVALNPTSGSSHWQRALALRELKRMDEAMEEAVRAVEIEPAFIRKIGPNLVKLGYLRAETTGADLKPMLDDAVRACMLDERCE